MIYQRMDRRTRDSETKSTIQITTSDNTSQELIFKTGLETHTGRETKQ